MLDIPIECGMLLDITASQFLEFKGKFPDTRILGTVQSSEAGT